MAVTNLKLGPYATGIQASLPSALRTMPASVQAAASSFGGSKARGLGYQVGSYLKKHALFSSGNISTSVQHRVSKPKYVWDPLSVKAAGLAIHRTYGEGTITGTVGSERVNFTLSSGKGGEITISKTELVLAADAPDQFQEIAQERFEEKRDVITVLTAVALTKYLQQIKDHTDRDDKSYFFGTGLSAYIAGKFLKNAKLNSNQIDLVQDNVAALAEVIKKLSEDVGLDLYKLVLTLLIGEW